MKWIKIYLLSLIIVSCSNVQKDIRELPSPIPMQLNYNWKYYHRNPINGSLRIDGTKTIIDTVTYETKKYYKIECVDKVLNVNTTEYWCWDEPVFNIYLRNMENKLVLHFSYSSVLNDTLNINGQKSVLIDTASTFENFDNCWKYEISGISDALRKFYQENNMEIKYRGPAYHYIKLNIGFLNDAGGRFLGDFKLNL